MGGQTCLSWHVFEKPPFMPVFQLRKKSTSSWAHSAISRQSGRRTLAQQWARFTSNSVTVYARDKIQMVPER